MTLVFVLGIGEGEGDGEIMIWSGATGEELVDTPSNNTVIKGK